MFNLMVARLAIAIALGAALARTQVRLTEEGAVGRALAARASISAATQRARAAEARQRQAGVWPNPRLTLATEGVQLWQAPEYSFAEESEYFAFVNQLFETGGKRARRSEEAGAAARVAMLERDLESARLASQVRQAYWSAATADRRSRVLNARVREMADMTKETYVLVSAGSSAEWDLVRLQLEGQRLEILANAAELDATRKRILLLAEMGSTDFPEVEFVSPFEPVIEHKPPQADEAVQHRIELQIARAKVERARAGLRLARAERSPDVDVQFGYKRAAGFDTLIGGVEIPLPFLNRHQGDIAAAEHEVLAAEASMRAQEALVKAEVQAASQELGIRERQLLQLLPGMRTRARDNARLSRLVYNQGGYDVIRLIDSQRNDLEAELLYCEALGEYNRARVALDYATGAKP